MAHITSTATAPRPYPDADVAEFRAEAVRAVLWILPVGILAIAASFIVNYDGTPIALGALTPALLILIIAGYRLVEQHATVAALLIVTALLSMIAAAAWIQPFSLFAALFGLVILIAGATLGTGAMFAAAGIATGVVLVAWLGPQPVVTADVGLASISLVVGSAVGCWIATRPLHVALEWSWHSYDQARDIADQLRDRQGELGRVNKSLNEAYLQLERLNDELARARRAADEARRLKSEFAANISHELRTPLNLIIGFSEMMTRAPQAYGGEMLSEAYRRDLDTIQRNARHLSELIDDVLDLSQIEASRMGLSKERLSLASVAEEATTAVARLISGRGLAVNVQIPDGLPEIYADRTRIRQILINLLSNAARFTDVGSITVSAAVDGCDIHMSVADTGIGIADEDLPKVFEEFRQLDGSIRRRAGGSGLGLAVSKQFVELHGGSIWVESHVGAGTAFHFTIPLESNVIASAPPGDWRIWDQRMATRPAPAPEVAIVSADPGVARIFQRYLDGYQVISYASLRDLPARAAGDPARSRACVVVASSAQAAWHEVETWESGADGMPIVVCALPSKRDLARELGAAAYLVKPVSRERVQEALKELRTRLRTILIVDDDPDMLRLLGRMVRSMRRGCGVWLAGSGEEAIAILRSRRPDAVLLDLLMPGVDGYAVLREIRTDGRLRDLPVIAITAHGEEQEAVTAGLIGVTRRDGLSVSDLMRCLRASLGALLPGANTGIQAPGGDPPVPPA